MSRVSFLLFEIRLIYSRLGIIIDGRNELAKIQNSMP